MLPSNLRRFWVCKYTAKCFDDIVVRYPCGFLRVNFLFKSVLNNERVCERERKSLENCFILIVQQTLRQS